MKKDPHQDTSPGIIRGASGAAPDEARASPQDDAVGPGRPAGWVVRAIRSVVAPTMKVLFRPALEGTEHLPTEGPFLLVANHSAGVGLAELTCFAALYLTRIGPERPLAGFAHPIGFRLWPFSAFMRSLGAVPSTYEDAQAAIDAGVPLLVFPGGDHETLRPIHQARKVDFGGRRGFLRIARRAQLPIVPMGIAGSHYTAPVLVRSKLLAWALIVPRLMGVKRWGISALGLLGAALIALLPLPWALRGALIFFWLGSPLIFLPIIPWTIGFRVGPPIPPDALFGALPPDDDLAGPLRTVEGTIQRLVDDLHQ